MTVQVGRFDDRLAPHGKDGTDFVSFASEALKAGHFDRLMNQRYLRPHFTGGNDGAIDLVLEGNQRLAVVECKFFGKDRNGKPREDWAAVAKGLKKNLAAIASGYPIRVPKIYAPWFRKDIPIDGYWFCTSGQFDHEGDQSTLRQEIRAFFATLAREYPALDHLTGIDVQVLGWNDFVGAIERSPPLRFRWFGGIPSGLVQLEYPTEAKRFHEFLSGGQLPFFSRKRFNEEVAREKSVMVKEEAAFLSRLLNEREQRLGLILAGRGGIGKTRLALELGREAKAGGWLVLRVEPAVSGAAIEQLARLYSDAAHVLLVIDYAEGVALLSNLATAVDGVNRNGHCFRFIATCRTGALPSVKDTLNEFDIDIPVHNLGDEPAHEYGDWVVRQILAFGGVPNAYSIGDVCVCTPVLAAFATFLWKYYPETFDRQFRDIHRGENFKEWTEKRLRLAFQDRHIDINDVSRLVAVIALRLPLADRQYDALRETSELHARVLDVLENDKWTERKEGVLSAIHDIFADALIARHLLGTATTVTARAGDILTDAIASDSLGRVLVSLDRLAEHPQYCLIDGPALLRRLSRTNSDCVVEARGAILRGRLLDDSEKIDFLRDAEGFALAVQSDWTCDGPVSQLAVGTVKTKKSDRREEAIRVLQPLLDRAVTRGQTFRMVLGRALRLIPDRHREQAMRCIQELRPHDPPHLLVAWMLAELPLLPITDKVQAWLGGGGNRDLLAGRIFSAWLDHGGSQDLIQDDLLTWLLEQSQEDEASFVFSSWLRAKGDPGTIEAHVLTWLAEHETDPAASFVYRSWLDAKGSPGTIEAHVLAWLAKHETDPAAQFVHQSWLDAKGSPGKIEAHVLAWVAEHKAMAKASFLFASWLRTTGDPETIEPHVLAWMAKHETGPAARFVYQSWLDAKGSPREIEGHVLAWLAKHETNPAAQFVYKSWLDAKGDPGKIKAHLLAWLAEHETGPAARFVYQSWLDAKGDPGTIEAHVLTWLAEHETDPAASFVYKSWLDAKGSPGKIEGHVLAWLAKHETDPAAQFVYKSWLDAKGSPGTIEGHVLAWVAEHKTMAKASFLFPSWLRATGDPETIEPHVVAWLAVAGHDTTMDAQFIYKSWLDAKGSPGKIEAHVLAWLAKHETDKLAEFVYNAWLKSGQLPDKISSHVLAWLDTNGTDEPEAGYVYNGWLRWGGELKTVRAKLMEWFSCHALTYEAGYLYRRWLNTRGPLAEVENLILAWLVEFHEQEHAGVVYWSWLDAGGTVSAIEQYLLTWRTRHHSSREAGEVYRAWLVAKQPVALIIGDLLIWLRKYGLNAEAGALFIAWLTVEAPVETIKPFVVPWLAKHSTTKIGQAVAEAWHAGTN